MGVLITNADFVGRVKVATNAYTQPEMDRYIALYEEPYLIKLLGVEFFNAFKADLDVNKVPQNPLYLAIYNSIRNDDNAGCPEVTLGMKQMILGFIYFEYMRDQCFQPTISGTRKNETEVSKSTTFDESNIYSRWNESVESAKAIQSYIESNSDDYPTYNGESFEKQFTHWAL